jgi:hypothetical protein
MPVTGGAGQPQEAVTGRDCEQKMRLLLFCCCLCVITYFLARGIVSEAWCFSSGEDCSANWIHTPIAAHGCALRAVLCCPHHCHRAALPVCIIATIAAIEVRVPQAWPHAPIVAIGNLLADYLHCVHWRSYMINVQCMAANSGVLPEGLRCRCGG